MNPTELVETLAGKGVRLSVEGGDLKCRGPKSALTPETLAQLKAQKAEVLETLAQPPANDPVDTPKLNDESLEYWLKRVRDHRRRMSGGEPEPPRRPPDDDEPPRRDPQPAPDDRPRLDPLAHRGTEKAAFYAEVRREDDERRRRGDYPPWIKPVGPKDGAP